MRFGSLFSGIGGFDIGLERAGMQCQWQVEIDDYATRVLERHWPDVQRWRDIADFIADASCNGFQGDEKSNGSKKARKQASRRRDDERCSRLGVDLICGGFPCQPVSLAGSRQGDADERWLWDAYREVVQILRPPFVLAENVPGLRSAKDSLGRPGGLMRGILRDLADLWYDAEWGSIPAAAFDLPHLRYRVFIVAYRQGDGWNQGRAEPEGLQGGHDAAECGATTSDSQHRNIRRRAISRQEGNGRSEVHGSARTASDASSQGSLPSTQRGIHSEEKSTGARDEQSERHRWRTVEPTVCRGPNGVPNRVDRLRCLGNAVVPQVAEWLGRRIMERVQT